MKRTGIEKIKKRDGRIVPFKEEKIAKVIWAAAQAVGGKDKDKAKKLSDEVVKILSRKYEHGGIPSVEHVQDIVEKVLIENGHAKTAKAYILYREQHKNIREVTKLLRDITIVDDYISELDWRVRENSNMTYSLQGLNVHITHKVISNYWLNSIYPKEIRDAHINGEFHIHDLGTLGAYTYFGKETVIAKLDGKLLVTSFQRLYTCLKGKEKLLSKVDDAWAKYPKNLLILDKNGWTRATRLVKKAKRSDMHFIKNEGGRSVIVTDNHPMIFDIEGKTKEAKEVEAGNHKTLTVDLENLLKKERLFYKKRIFLAEELFKRGIKDFWIDGMPLEEYVKYSKNFKINGTVSTNNNANTLPNRIDLSENLGYLVGYCLAEGSTGTHKIRIKQKRTRENEETFERLKIAAHGLGCRLYARDNDDITILQIANTTFVKYLIKEIFTCGGLSRNKILPEEILSYNKKFVKGLVAGVIDGDGSINTGRTSIDVRTSSRTMLEQLATVLCLLGFVARDRNLEGVGTEHEFKGKKLIQNYPLYGVSFRTRNGNSLPSFKYKSAETSSKAWRAEGEGWHKILNNESTEIMDDYIYDITTDSSTLLVNGMWNHNCVGWDLEDLLRVGFRGVRGKIESNPAKHFDVALMQIVNFMYTLQGEAAGAQALSSFDTLLAPFIYYDKLDYEKVKQSIQKFLFNMNVPTRVGFQTPFTNITLDLTVPEFMRNSPVIVGGKIMDKTYSDFGKEMGMLNKAFAETMFAGDATGRPFSVDGDCLCLIKNSEKIKLVEIGRYIDTLMKERDPVFIKENGCQFIDVKNLNLKCMGHRNGKIGWQKINYVVRHPREELLKICVAGGFKIKVTPSHSVLVLKNGKIQPYQASQLRKGDYLISPKTIPAEEDIEEISLAHKLTKKGKTNGIYISGVRKGGKAYNEKRFCNGKYKYHYKVPVFPLKNIYANLNDFDLSRAKLNLAGSKIKIRNCFLPTNELVDFLGWYSAEGSAEKGRYGGISLGFNLKKERERAYYVADLARKVFGIHPHIREIEQRNLIEVRIHSKLIRKIITEVFEIGNGREKRIPNIIFGLSPEKKKIFLNAYFEGDGWITDDVIANSISKELIYGISTLLKQLNIFHTLSEYSWNGKKYWRINIWNNKKLKVKDSSFISKIPIKESGLRELAKKIAEKEPHFYDKLGRKYKNTHGRILKKFRIDHQESTSIENAKKIREAANDLFIKIPSALEEIKENNLLFLKVKKVENDRSSNGMVYDFSTESENFVADQFLVHNTFPIPTYNITRDFEWDKPEFEPIWKMTAKYGIPYFANFINSDMHPDDVRSMCCRLMLDKRKLKMRGGGLFGSNPLTGSVGVVTINLPRIAYESENEQDFFDMLEKRMELAKESLIIKRQVLEKFTDDGLYPYSRFYLRTIKQAFDEYWKNHFSTIGIIGMNDALLNFSGHDITSPKGTAFAISVLDFMRDKLADFQEETGNIFNLEATPAEGTSYRLARIDKKKFPRIKVFNQERYGGRKSKPYYTNSTQLPVGFTNDIFTALKLQDQLQIKYTGGTVLHGFLGEKMPSTKATKTLVKTIAENFRLPYFTLTPTFSICPKHGYLVGEHKYCPKCDEEMGIKPK